MTPLYKEQLGSITDIIKSGIDFGMTQPTTRYFRSDDNTTTDKTETEILSGYKLCESAPICLQRIARKKLVVVVLLFIFYFKSRSEEKPN